jgi:exodeoxyribonuclease V alpha subunit
VYFSGKINSIVFSNAVNGFYIMKIFLDNSKTPEESLVTVKGIVTGLDVKIGSWIPFEGEWIKDPRYGKQLQIIKAPSLKGGISTEIAKNLLVGAGIGPYLIQSLVQFFDKELPKALRDKKRLSECKELTEIDIELIYKKWEIIIAYYKTLEFFNGFPNLRTKIRSIWRRFGDETTSILSQNPWKLAELGIPLEILDEIADKLGVPKKGTNRMKGVIQSHLFSIKDGGHLFIKESELLHYIQSFINNDILDFPEALEELVSEKKVVIEPKTGYRAVYEEFVYDLETNSARLLRMRNIDAVISSTEDYQKGLIDNFSDISKEDTFEEACRKAIAESGKGYSLNLTETQIQGILNGLVQPISIITGLPGTGKTLSLKILVKLLTAMSRSILMVAPTGIAAKRMHTLTGLPAYTIHRAFGAKEAEDSDEVYTYSGIVERGSTTFVSELDNWKYSARNPHPAEVIIIDESSMLDIHLLYRIITCTKPSSKIIFVGDAAQLPSVGPGNVLRDLINSNVFPVTFLYQIFRQEDTSAIILAAHDIFNGRVPQYGDLNSDFLLVSTCSEDQTLSTLIQIVTRMYSKTQDTKNSFTFQVLSPKHKGKVGVTNLNSKLRELLNPESENRRQVKIGSEYIREGDRIMIVKNDYELGVYNGDIGKVTTLNTAKKEAILKILGDPDSYVTMKFQKLHAYVRLAYASTVHKYQGLEVDIVIFPILNQFYGQLQRNLFYTAVTRAKKKVILVGQPEAVAKAVFNDKQDKRNTLLMERLVG